MPRWMLGVLLVLSMWCGPVLADEGAERARLLRGVRSIAAPGVPGPVCVYGPDAFVVVSGRVSPGVVGAVVAASRQGRGRAVAFGHPGYFDAKSLRTGDTATLLVNAVSWCARGSAAPRVGVRGGAGLRQLLAQRGMNATGLDDARWPERLSAMDVVCVQPGSMSDSEISAVQAFVERGGGVVAADLGWGWLQLNPGRTLHEHHPGNRMLRWSGLAWSDGYLERTRPDGYEAPGAVPEQVNAQAALDVLSAEVRAVGALAQASWTLTNAVETVPDGDSILLPRLDRFRAATGATAVPTAALPLTLKNAATARVALALEVARARRLPPQEVKAHPAARVFPGAVPTSAPRGGVAVTVGLGETGWHGTGRYAAPGEVVTVVIPARAAGEGLRVRIGAHTDVLWDLDSWSRVPEITLTAPLRQPRTAIASAFGGPVYVEVPNGRHGFLEVRVEGAVAAPRFVLGETADWASARLYPAPWAELEGRRVILTVPSEEVRRLDDPTVLMQFWDRVADACADLAARPHERGQRERIVTDVQLSAGYMHSGYPITAHLDAAPVMVDLARLKKEGSWGLFHELGHNHQSDDWTFEGTGEVTCNLFTRYVLDTICGIPPQRQENSGARQLRAYLARGTPFARWKEEPFLALLMYDQLQKAFGWGTFKKVFAEYRALPEGRRPKSDEARRDRWTVALSRTVGRNLGPFFQAWGVPTSASARASIAGLPAWMPAEMRR